MSRSSTKTILQVEDCFVGVGVGVGGVVLSNVRVDLRSLNCLPVIAGRFWSNAAKMARATPNSLTLAGAGTQADKGDIALVRFPGLKRRSNRVLQ